MLTAYASRSGNCFREHLFPFDSHLAIDGTNGTIGTPSIVCHSVGPWYEGTATIIMDGRSVCGRWSGANIIDSKNILGIIHLRQIRMTPMVPLVSPCAVHKFRVNITFAPSIRRSFG